ncbi:MAG: hypothetical protein LC798_05585 [Chloroflexi bacterium]|nr:hypothetical protein [Chloroflexota bacterium]
MIPSPSSTVPAFKSALVAALAEALPGVQVAYRWPGPSTEDEGVYLGDWSFTKEFAAIKTGRQPRMETYRLTVILQSFTAARRPEDAAVADARVSEFEAALDGVLADDPDLGRIVRSARVAEGETETKEFETGVAIRMTVTVAVDARLT